MLCIPNAYGTSADSLGCGSVQTEQHLHRCKRKNSNIEESAAIETGRDDTTFANDKIGGSHFLFG